MKDWVEIKAQKIIMVKMKEKNHWIILKVYAVYHYVYATAILHF